MGVIFSLARRKDKKAEGELPLFVKLVLFALWFESVVEGCVPWSIYIYV